MVMLDGLPQQMEIVQELFMCIKILVLIVEGYTNYSAGNDYSVTNFNASFILKNGDFFTINCWHNDTFPTTINAQTNCPGSRLSITII